MVCPFAPDGSIQPMVMMPTFDGCIGVIKLLHEAKLGKSYAKLSLAEFRVLPIKLTIVQNGDENKPF
jgi:hypothetical protein